MTDGAGNVSETVKSVILSSDKEGNGSSPSFHYGNGKSVFVDKKCHTLTWKARQEAAQVQEHLRLSIHRMGTVTENMTGGSCTVTKNGVYEFMVMDKFGNSEAAEVLVTKIDNEATETGFSYSRRQQTGNNTADWCYR